MPHPSDGHAGHDLLLVAAYAAGDATGPELDDALATVATCPDCAALHHDLRAIATATATLTAPVRTRDFRLTSEQAAALHPAGWRRLLAPFAGPRFAFAGPLGGTLAALGVVGILVAGGVGVPMGGATSSVLPTVGSAIEQPESGGVAAGAASAAPAEQPDLAPVPSVDPSREAQDSQADGGADSYATASQDARLFGQPPAATGPSVKTDAGDSDAARTSEALAGPRERELATAPNGSSPIGQVGLLAGVVLLVGLGLGGLRLGARFAFRRGS